MDKLTQYVEILSDIKQSCEELNDCRVCFFYGENGCTLEFSPYNYPIRKWKADLPK